MSDNFPCNRFHFGDDAGVFDPHYPYNEKEDDSWGIHWYSAWKQHDDLSFESETPGSDDGKRDGSLSLLGQDESAILGNS